MASLVSLNIGVPTSLFFMSATLGLSACIHSKFHSYLVSSYTVHGYPVGRLTLLGINVGQIIGVGASRMMSSLLTPSTGFACAGGLLGLAAAQSSGQWYHRKRRQKKFNLIRNQDSSEATSKLICELAGIQTDDLHEQANQS